MGKRKETTSDLLTWLFFILIGYIILKLLGLLPEFLPDPEITVDTLFSISVAITSTIFVSFLSLFLKLSDIYEKLGSLTERVNQNTIAIQELKTAVTQNTQAIQELKTSLS